MISKEDYKLLSAMLRMKNHEFVETNRPNKIDYWRVKRLVKKGLIDEMTILPEGKESHYPNGLISYRVSPDGEDSVADFREQRKSNRAQKTKNACKEFFSGAGCLIQTIAAVVAAITGLIAAMRK